MRLTFTYANQKHLKWLKEKDHHIDSAMLKKKITDKQIIIAKLENKFLGWLRFGFFWDSIPFMNMLLIEEEYRSKGIGKKIVQFWETEMKKKKYKIVMTSSLSNENAQHFYRKLGYIDAGALAFPKEPLEIIFIKKL